MPISVSEPIRIKLKCHRPCSRDADAAKSRAIVLEVGGEGGPPAWHRIAVERLTNATWFQVAIELAVDHSEDADDKDADNAERRESSDPHGDGRQS
jgi:hypothetical protein